MEHNTWNRLARPAVFVEIISAIRSYALIILYFAYRAYNRTEEFSIFNSFDLFLDFLFNVIPAFLVIISGVMEYKRYKYRLTEEHLLIHRGWIRREKKSIPVDKIQSVQVEQNWLYRMLNIYLVKIDTIGENEVEAEVGGVRINEALRLKQRVQALKSQNIGELRDEEKYEDDLYNYELSNRMISRYAFTENLLWVVIPVVLTGILVYRLYLMTDLSQLNIALIFKLLFGDYDAIDIEGAGTNLTMTYIMLYLLIIGGFSSSLVFFNRILGLFNFNLVIRSSEIFIQRGIINKFETIIPRRKIQFVTWYTNWIRKGLGIYTMSYKYAGSRRTLASDAIVPFFDEKVLPELIAPYHRITVDNSEKQPNEEDGSPMSDDSGATGPIFSGPATGIHRSYILRNFVFVKLPFSLLLLFMSYWVHSFLFYAAFLLPVYFVFHNIFFVKNYRFWLFRDYLVIKKGVWGRRYYVVKWEKVQKVSLIRTPYQRRAGLSNLILGTASSNIFIPYVNLEIAEEMKDYGLYKTEISKHFLF